MTHAELVKKQWEALGVCPGWTTVGMSWKGAAWFNRVRERLGEKMSEPEIHLIIVAGQYGLRTKVAERRVQRRVSMERARVRSVGLKPEMNGELATLSVSEFNETPWENNPSKLGAVNLHGPFVNLCLPTQAFERIWLAAVAIDGASRVFHLDAKTAPGSDVLDIVGYEFYEDLPQIIETYKGGDGVEYVKPRQHPIAKALDEIRSYRKSLLSFGTNIVLIAIVVLLFHFFKK